MDWIMRHEGIFLRNKTKFFTKPKQDTISVSPFDTRNSSMINGHSTYHVKNVVVSPTATSETAWLRIDRIIHNPFETNASQTNQPTDQTIERLLSIYC